MEELPTVQRALVGCSLRLLLIIIILVKLLVIFRTYMRKRMDGKSKGFIEVNISSKLISPWQNSGSRLILSTKSVGAQSVFELDASSDNVSDIKENRLPSHAQATKCRL